LNGSNIETNSLYNGNAAKRFKVDPDVEIGEEVIFNSQEVSSTSNS
jgi:hypothetical protein